jgi:N-acetylglucosamine-6-sulfatase
MRVSPWLLLCAGIAGCAAPPATDGGGVPAPTGDPPRQPPAIVLIFADDQRYDTLGCTGHPFVRTPNLDRIAREGALFENAFVITPLCCPSRATVLSGLYTHGNGVSNNGMDLDYGTTRILPQYLQERGYATAFIGKIHLGYDARPRPGFDYWAALDETDENGVHFDTRMNVNGVTTETSGFNADVLAGLAADWIAKQDGPFFLLLSLKSPHNPLTPPERHAGLYADAEITLPPSFDDPVESLPAAVRQRLRAQSAQEWMEGYADRHDAFRELLRSYARMIPAVDDAAGRIYETLARSGRLDRTAVIFSSDNGWIIGEHGISRKGLAYDPSIRVPLLVRYPPAVPAGSRLRQQALNLDLTPTVLDLAGVAAPPEMRGRSLLPLLGGDSAGWREDWLYVGSYREDAAEHDLAVRTDEWKYVRYTGGEPEEQLFHLAQDPHERTNLAADPAHAARLDALRARMRALMAREDVPPGWWGPGS